ncbi:MAG: hypothetical protein N4A49_13855 [Marinifilaceae bacterium]|nr:hypothetical protein [Marinifilaceae bacterium]
MKNFLMLFIALISYSCTKTDNDNILIAKSKNQWTGIAVSKEGRIFVNFPKWSDNVPISLAEIINGEIKSFPNEDQKFDAVQSIYIDNKNRLWVLDTRNPKFKGVLEGGPKLYLFDLNSNQIRKEFQFKSEVYKSNSYFNDIRVDSKTEMAYMTDSGNGALIILNIKTGESKRVLDNHPSTESEINYLICNDIKWENSVHSDGIAISPDNKYIYYIALTGHSLYRIPTSYLNNFDLDDKILSSKIEKISEVPATDGMIFDNKYNLYLGGLEDNSINKLLPNGNIEKIAKSKSISWADSFSIFDGELYFTTSQIHLALDNREEYTIRKIKIN